MGVVRAEENQNRIGAFVELVFNVDVWNVQPLTMFVRVIDDVAPGRNRLPARAQRDEFDVCNARFLQSETNAVRIAARQVQGMTRNAVSNDNNALRKRSSGNNQQRKE